MSDLQAKAAALLAWAEANTELAIGAGVLALVAGVLGFLLVRVAVKAGRVLVAALVKLILKAHAKWGTEDLLTMVAAGIATGVSAQGMWRFAGDKLGLDGPLRLLLFAFIEIAVITSAVRARRNMRDKLSAGIDGIAVWALTGLSAVLSSMDARNMPEAVFRLAAPLVAAWMWERGMALERRRATGSKRVAWRFTISRLLVLLGLADPTDRDASDMAIHRYITRVSKSAKRLRMLPEKATRRRRWAAARLDRAADRAVEYAGLADNPEAVAKLMRQLGIMYGIAELASLQVTSPAALQVASPWVPASSSRPRLVVRRRPRRVPQPRPRMIVRRASGRLDVSAPEPVQAPGPELTVERTNPGDPDLARLLAALRAPSPALQGRGSLGGPSDVQTSRLLRVNGSHGDPDDGSVTGHESPDAPTGDQGNGSRQGHDPHTGSAVTGPGSPGDPGQDVWASGRLGVPVVTTPAVPVLFQEPTPLDADDPTHDRSHGDEDDPAQEDSVASHVRATVAAMGVDLFTVTPKEIMTRFERAGIAAKLDTIRSSLRRERARVAETASATLTRSV